MMKTKENKEGYYYYEERNEERFALTLHLVAILICVGNFIYNNSKNLIESQYINIIVIVFLAIGLLLYFISHKYLVSTFIFILASSLGTTGVIYYEGHVSLNFLYYFVIIVSIPFLLKRNKKFLRNNYILFITVGVIAAISITISPVNPRYPFLTADDIYTKMFINTIISLFGLVVFSVVVVYTSRNFLIARFKDKMIAEREKDKRMIVLSSLGHELRTQINSINGITQLITELKSESNPNRELIEDYAKILDKCNDQMLSLVNDVLDIHKIESGKFELIDKPESLNRLLIKISNEFNLIARTKHIIFKTEISPAITTLNLVFDKLRVTQILTNLLRNAIKYTDEGEITLRALLIEETTDKASILFKIEDTGIGISENNYSKIFESFQQIKNENSDIYGGTGLGLSLTKTILNKMNSSISIESVINQGSIFSFKIDFRKTNQENTVDNIEAIMSNKSCLKETCILIADDNKVNLLYTDTLLKNYEAKTFFAKDGYEAVEMVKNNSEIDIVLLDIEMPNLNGLQAIKQIKDLKRDQRIIAFTATSPNEEFIQKLYSYGFDDFIIKPFKKEELIKTIYLNKIRSIPYNS